MTATTYRTRLIERALPLKEVSAQSAREKSIRHGHISTLHIWWARRPLAACRAAIYAALLDDPTDDAEREVLLKEVADLSNWDIVNGKDHTHLLDKARARIMANRSEAPRILDPFSGGGAIPLEALRLGGHAYANELNPVAHIIELCTLVYPQKYGVPGDVPNPTLTGGTISVQNKLAEDVKRWGKWVLDAAKEDIGRFYPAGADGATPVAYLWARTVTCPNPACRADVPLVRQTWLAKGRGLALKARVEGKNISYEVVGGLKATDLAGDTPSDDETGKGDGNSRRGSATCLVCTSSFDNTYVKAEGMEGRIGHKAMAVVGTRKGEVKSYRPATLADDLLAEAAEVLRHSDNLRNGNLSVVPNELIFVEDTRNFWVGNYGVKQWGQLFNSRQALALATFAAKVREAYDLIHAEAGDDEYARAVATYLACMVDRLADFCSTGCVWASDGGFIAHTFGRQALPMVWDYAEVNPFSGATGDWDGAVDWVVGAIEHCSNTGISANTRLGTATRMSYPDSYFDAVITDPPYYDAVPYADLSDFFYVWLRRTIGTLYPDVFKTPLTPKSAEIVQNPIRHGGNGTAKAFFEQEMGKAFCEAARVLKPDGIAVTVFAHKSTDAWETLINSLLDAGLYVTASWPLNTERPGRLRAQNSAALASSFFIVCRKRDTAGGDGYYVDVLPQMEANVRQRLAEFWAQGINGPDFFISAIGPALQAFGAYRVVKLPDGLPVPTSKFLTDVRRVVADFALERILQMTEIGTVDPESRFYLFWRWSYGAADAPFDEARKLAQALGVQVNELLNKTRGILRQKGDKARIRGIADRRDVEGLGLRGYAGGAPGLIDVLHRACLENGIGGAAAVAAYLAGVGKADDDTFWAYAQALSDLLPDSDNERTAIHTLLTVRGAVQSNAANVEKRRPTPKPGEGQMILIDMDTL